LDDQRDKKVKDIYKLELSGHQAKVLNSALLLVRQIVALPPGQPLYNIPTEGTETALVKDEFDLIHSEVIRQFEEQDKK
jgi:hypothetical protein